MSGRVIAERQPEEEQRGGAYFHFRGVQLAPAQFETFVTLCRGVYGHFVREGAYWLVHPPPLAKKLIARLRAAAIAVDETSA